MGKTSLTSEEKAAIPTSSDTPAGMNHLIFKMALYLAKMSMHDYELSGRRPSLVGIGSLYVALKICEQMARADPPNKTIVCVYVILVCASVI